MIKQKWLRFKVTTSYLFRRYWFEIILILPLFIYVLGFTLAPVIQNILLSFQKHYQGGDFPTFDSYRLLFSRYGFIEALTNTIVIALVSVSFELLIGLSIAVMLSQEFKGRGIFRAIMLLPMGIPTVVAATNMRYIFASSGYLNEFLYDISNFLIKLGIINNAFPTLNFLQEPLALFGVAISDMWKVTPLVMLILLAGLESIPRDIYEAAEVDGATLWQRFTQITLPLLRPAITSAVIIRGIDAFRIFVHPLALGVSGQVPVLASFAYKEYINVHLTTSAASSTILLFMILIAVVAYLRLVGVHEVIR
ncbi:MAG TPA: sugar ABC transporter permease [Anaerolineae bacterium]|nr:sugar ABC transporter permease [Anaerolineae bacterium]